MISIDIDCQVPVADIDKLSGMVEFICERFNVENAVVNISIVGDERICEVNKQFLEHNYITDVISFDLSDENSAKSREFDIVVNAELAVREAEKRSHSGETELALYICHGLLHNLGFDDLNEADAKKMHRQEDEILQSLGFGVVYGSEYRI